MPILLDTPYTQPGIHGQPGSTYPMVQITKFTVEPTVPCAILVVEYGNVVDGKWVSAKDVEPNRIVKCDTPEETGVTTDPATNLPMTGVTREAVTDFTDMKSDATLKIKAADDGVDYYDGLGRDLFLWLIANGYYAGTPV